MSSEPNRPPLHPVADSSEHFASFSVQDQHLNTVSELDMTANVNRINRITKDFLDRESEANKQSVPNDKSKSSTNSVGSDMNKDDHLSETGTRTDFSDCEINITNNNGDTQSVSSELDSDDEGNISDRGVLMERPISRKYDPSIDDRLPDTVTLFTTPHGSKMYLIGTSHFSEESQNDVSTIIQAVQPDIVMVELCKARIHVMQLDEKTILQEVENLSFQAVRNMIQQNGPFNGLLYILLLSGSAHLTRQLGMAPGGEFRRAFAEAKKIPNCMIHLGDRPINITLHRALSSLGWWQTIKLACHLLMDRDPISKEEVERCKRRDMLEEMLAQMADKYPTLGEVFIRERDLYLTYSLQLACMPQLTSTGARPTRVVGVVGMGHMPGIIELWGKVQSSEILRIMIIPPPSLSSKILRATLKVSLIGAAVFVAYKVIPLPSSLSVQSIKSSVEGLLKVSVRR